MGFEYGEQTLWGEFFSPLLRFSPGIVVRGGAVGCVFVRPVTPSGGAAVGIIRFLRRVEVEGYFGAVRRAWEDVFRIEVDGVGFGEQFYLRDIFLYCFIWLGVSCDWATNGVEGYCLKMWENKPPSKS